MNDFEETSDDEVEADNTRINTEPGQDAKWLKEPSKGWKYLGELISYPPLKTSHFNDDGTNFYRSKIQILIFLPSVLAIVLLAVIFILPLEI